MSNIIHKIATEENVQEQIDKKTYEHFNIDSIFSEKGSHGLRYYDYDFNVLNENNEW